MLVDLSSINIPVMYHKNDMFTDHNFKQYELERKYDNMDIIEATQYVGLFECKGVNGGPICIAHSDTVTFHSSFHSIIRLFRGKKILFICCLEWLTTFWDRDSFIEIIKFYKSKGYKIVAYDHETRFHNSIYTCDEWLLKGKIEATTDFEKFRTKDSVLPAYVTGAFQDYMRSIHQWLEECNLIDELWTFSIFNYLEFGSQHKIPIKYFIPFTTRVYDFDEAIFDNEYEYDILYFGTTTSEYRQDMVGAIDWLKRKKGYNFKCITNDNPNEDINEVIRKSKIVVNIPGWADRGDSEVLRMYQVLGNYSMIITKLVPSSRMCYADVPYYYNDKEEMIRLINEAIEGDKWKQMKRDQIKRWKNLSELMASRYKKA